MYAKCPKSKTGNERGREEETLEYSMKFHFLKFTSAQLRRNKYEAKINTQNKIILLFLGVFQLPLNIWIIFGSLSVCFYPLLVFRGVCGPVFHHI